MDMADLTSSGIMAGTVEKNVPGLAADSVQTTALAVVSGRLPPPPAPLSPGNPLADAPGRLGGKGTLIDRYV